MKIIICPYCKNKLNTCDNRYFDCRNHGNIMLNFYILKNEIMWTNFKHNNINWNIIIHHNKNFMNIYEHYSSVSLPSFLIHFIDFSLTPENFEQKLKTYLIFQ